jgi:hypothetical protein
MLKTTESIIVKKKNKKQKAMAVIYPVLEYTKSLQLSLFILIFLDIIYIKKNQETLFLWNKDISFCLN